MNYTLTKKEKPLVVLFEGWINIPHSYAICFCFQLINLYKNYGPNGIIKKNALTIYVTEMPYYNPMWNNNKKLVYSDEYNDILRNLKIYKNEDVDLIYRQTYPYNITITEQNKHIPKCVFYTSEFKKLDHSYFVVNTPELPNDITKEKYISLYLNEFKNIYLTSPSEWSSKGMDEFSISNERNRIITHGVDTSIFKKNQDNSVRNSIRKKYGIKDSDILMINIGGTTTNKGILLIIELLHILVNVMGKTEYKVMFKGSDDLYKCTEFIKSYFQYFISSNIISENEMNNLIDNHIIYTSKTLSFERINDLYNSANLYISPYLAEGFGMCMLEALASGLNVLVPRTGSTEKYITDIYNNGGEEYITFVGSFIGRDSNSGKCQNVIQVNDIVEVILNSDLKKEHNKENYTTMIKYIEKELSWNHVSTLLLDYFNFIVERE